MATILDYYEYSKLAAAAYVRLDDGLEVSQANLADQSNSQNRLPGALAAQTFIGSGSDTAGIWTIPTNGYHGNDDAGFAATLFQRGSEKVLAMRGTEPSGSNLVPDVFQADLAGIGILGMALAQTISMVNYILRLTAPVIPPAIRGGRK